MNTFEKIINIARAVFLTEEEKARSRRALISFMELKPVRSELDLDLQLYRPHYFFQNISLFARVMPAALVLVVFIGGGASLAAEGTIPGDPLYSVKTGVNEHVLGWFATSPQAKAEWAATKATRRLEEIEKLVSIGQTIALAETEAKFEEHANEVSQSVISFEDKKDFQSASEVSSDLETSLKAHEEIISKLAEGDEGAKSQLGEILGRLKVRSHALSLSRAHTESIVSGDDESIGGEEKTMAALAPGASTFEDRVVSHRDSSQYKTAAEEKLKTAEKKIAEVRAFVSAHSPELGADATVRLEEQLKIADAVVADGRAKLVAQMYGAAFTLFQKAGRIAGRGKVLSAARNELKVRVDLGAIADASDDRERKESGDDSSAQTVATPNEGTTTSAGAAGIIHDQGDDSVKGVGGDSTENEIEDHSGSGSGNNEDDGSLRLDL